MLEIHLQAKIGKSITLNKKFKEIFFAKLCLQLHPPPTLICNGLYGGILQVPPVASHILLLNTKWAQVLMDLILMKYRGQTLAFFGFCLFFFTLFGLVLFISNFLTMLVQTNYQTQHKLFFFLLAWNSACVYQNLYGLM